MSIIKELEQKTAEIENILVNQAETKKAIILVSEVASEDFSKKQVILNKTYQNFSIGDGKVKTWKQLGELDGKIEIQGIAIQEGEFKGIFYPAEILRKSANSLVGKPLRVDHGKGVKDIIGKVTKTWFNETLKAIEYKAEVFDTNIARLVKENLVNDVSVGMWVDSILNKKKEEVAHKIEFTELSLLENGQVETAHAEIVE